MRSHRSTNGIQRVAGAIRESGCVVVLTGAGVSAASGLRPFRDRRGDTIDPSLDGLDHAGVFAEAPELAWEYVRKNYQQVVDAVPNHAHIAIAQLERGALIDRVITQNVDGLHQKAGSRPLELHGSLKRTRCMGCGALGDLVAILQDSTSVPLCAECGAVLRLDVVLIGEKLDVKIAAEAVALVSRCDLLIVCGTSLAVNPARGLVVLARKHRALIAVINVGKVFFLRPDIRVRDPVESALPAIVDAVGREIPAGHGLLDRF